jgi:DnaK suppressor protein
MTTEQKQKIKDKILEDLSSLDNEIKELEEKLKPIEPDCCLGDLRFEMMNEQDVFEKVLREAQLRRSKLGRALLKVDEDDYGMCQECEEEIAYERLLILPESLYCVRCASNK